MRRRSLFVGPCGVVRLAQRRQEKNLSLIYANNRQVYYNKSSINVGQIYRTSSVPFLNKKYFHSSAFCNSVKSFRLTDIGEGIAEVKIGKWYVQVGDTIEEFQPVCEVESDKATLDISSPYSGKVKKLYHAPSDMAKVGEILMDIQLEGDTTEDTPNAPSSPSTTTSQQTPTEIYDPHTSKVLTTPAVRRIAKENNINISAVPGTGRDGRILKEDILAFIENGGVAKTSAPSSSTPPTHPVTSVPSTPISPPTSAHASVRVMPGDRVIALETLQRVMAHTMTVSAAIPHFGYCDEIIVDKMVEFRNQLRPLAESRGVKVTFMPIFIKAASMALHKFPIINSSLTPDLTQQIFRASHNIGVAMDTPKGLIVPNIKDVQSKGILEIAKELNRLQMLGKEGKLGPDDLKGGTFTLSNIGVVGGTYAKPILMPGETVIGAIGKLQKLPRYDADGNVVPTQIVCISWSADHRAIDGVTMASFSNYWKELIEHPFVHF